jgi:hypothetical protein
MLYAPSPPPLPSTPRPSPHPIKAERTWGRCQRERSSLHPPLTLASARKHEARQEAERCRRPQSPPKASQKSTEKKTANPNQNQPTHAKAELKRKQQRMVAIAKRLFHPSQSSPIHHPPLAELNPKPGPQAQVRMQVGSACADGCIAVRTVQSYASGCTVRCGRSKCDVSRPALG